MELNDINLLFWAGLLSLSLIGLTVFLAVCGGLAYFLSHLIDDHLWPALLNMVEGFGRRGERVSMWLRRSAFVLVWVVGPLALVGCVINAYAWFAGLNYNPRLVAHGKSPGDQLRIGDMTLRWVPLPKESESCWMLDSEVSQRNWRDVMGSHPGLKSGEDDFPVEVRNANEIRWYLAALNKKYAVLGWKWTIPNVEQWTTACNAGTVQGWSYWQGRSWTKENSGGVAHPIRRREPNAWGLYDMVGNVAEMCTDVGEMQGDLLLAGLSYKSAWTAERRFEPWVMDCYLSVEDDGWIFDETDIESGFRVCLAPTPYAYVHSGTIFGKSQSKKFRSLCNYVAVYGFVGLLLQVFMWVFGERIRAIKFMRWLLWLSVAEEFLRQTGLGHTGIVGFVRKWTMKFVAMLFKYTVGQILGYPISSLVASAVPSLPDLLLAPPDEWLMTLVIVATFPVLVISLCIYKNIRDVHVSWAWMRSAYCYVLLPATLFLAYHLVSDAIHQYCVHQNCDRNPYCVHPVHVPDPPDEVLVSEDD